MPTAHVNGVDPACELSESGSRPLVGNGPEMTIHSGRPLLDLVADWVTRLAMDRRALGSGGPPPGPHAMPTRAAEALGLLGAVRRNAALVAGVAFGGIVARGLAVTAAVRRTHLDDRFDESGRDAHTGDRARVELLDRSDGDGPTTLPELRSFLPGEGP